ncbi:MAG TPA: hypothetical protein VFF98_17480 [Novosphingobium sp.]|nr:hypothetical protein [Novosphingobium sp.]
MLLGVALRIWAFSPLDTLHPDELMQYFEQANRLVTGHGTVPWEYRYGIRSWLLPQLLAGPVALGHWLAPGTLAPYLAARIAFAALALISLPAAWRLGLLSGRREGLMALFVVAVWFESVLFGELLLSETLAAALMLLAAALLLADAPGRRALQAAGLLLGLGVVFRMQYAVFAAVLAAMALKADWRRWRWLIEGGLAALALGALSDLAMGRAPFLWLWRYYAMNVGDGRASIFGVSPPYAFVIVLLIHLGPAVLPILAAMFGAGRRYLPLLVAAWANIAAHSFIPHKEFRFIWLSLLSLLVLGAIGSVRGARWAQGRLGTASPTAAKTGSWLWLALFPAWWAASFGAQQVVENGAPLRKGGALAGMVIAADRQPGICGLAVPYLWRHYVVDGMLPRPLPLYLGPPIVSQYDTRPIDTIPVADRPPADLLGAANAIVMPSPGPVPQGYARQRCDTSGKDSMCLYTRPGSCTPAPRWGYQAVLQRLDM